jgi:hypothetical protein
LELNPGKKKKATKAKKSTKTKALLLGVGLDSQDEHVRITRGPNFQLVGGTRETHEMMQETAIKFNEELGKRGKPMEALEPKEFVDIIQKLK